MSTQSMDFTIYGEPVTAMTPQSRGHVDVLLIAIHPDLGRLLAEKLQLNCEVVCSPKDALAALAGRQYCVIVIDCLMPAVDCFELATEIRMRERPTGKYTPIVALVTSDIFVNYQKLIASGVDDFMCKPVNHTLLSVKLQHWMQADNIQQSALFRQQHLTTCEQF